MRFLKCFIQSQQRFPGRRNSLKQHWRIGSIRFWWPTCALLLHMHNNSEEHQTNKTTEVGVSPSSSPNTSGFGKMQHYSATQCKGFSATVRIYVCDFADDQHMRAIREKMWRQALHFFLKQIQSLSSSEWTEQQNRHEHRKMCAHKRPNWIRNKMILTTHIRAHSAWTAFNCHLV